MRAEPRSFRTDGAAPRALPPGLIFDIAEAAGIEVKTRKPKTPIRCPFHGDKTASAFLSENNVFYCSACTPDGGLSAKHFAEQLGVDWERFAHFEFSPSKPMSRALPPKRTFGASDAAEVWSVAYARMRDDGAVERDRDVWTYVERRRLSACVEFESFGIVAAEMTLPTAVSGWARTGYRIVAPLFDQGGEIANVQARSVTGSTPKTLFPTGSTASGTVFACSRGRALLRGAFEGAKQVLFAEGLTDHLALTIASPIPVLSAPGTSMAVAGIGPWVRDRELLAALDWDAAGEVALKAVCKRAFEYGAARVQRVEWPRKAKDACEALERSSLVDLERFIRRVIGVVST